MLRNLILTGVMVALVGCTDPGAAPAPSGPRLTTVGPSVSLPGPDTEVPTGATALAERLSTTSRALFHAIEAWRATPEGTTSWPPPDDVVLLALDQQRIYQRLAGTKDLRRAATRMLPRGLRRPARAIALAGARLASGSGTVTGTPRLDTADPLPVDVLRSYFEEAQARFGVDWELLAGINFIETRFGRVISKSSAGAQGPMQFIPSTWKAFGLGGDVYEPRDAILGAANYLRAAGALQHERRALLAYNPLDPYADAVHLYAQQIRRDESSYYAFYNWQVFVRTPSGELERLTGPGR